jgi:hypothetical protein
MANRIYNIEYKDTNNVEYIINIFKEGYTGESTLIGGYAVLEYGGVRNNLETIRGNGLSLILEANLDLTLNDLYSENENTFKIELKRNNELFFIGFIKPDGIFQDFVNDKWEITLECVDGLGLLENLAFVKENGAPYSGKLSALSIIEKCLRRSNLSLAINTAVNIYYQGQIPSDELDPLTEIYLSVNRFVKDDNDTIMDCAEVLTSVLSLFNAAIVQLNGQWYIYRPNEIYNNSIVKFRRYILTAEGFLYQNINERNFAFNLGSHINNKYPHHSNSNQRIGIKGSVSAYRINYKYGFESGLFANPSFIHEGLNYNSWVVLDSNLIVDEPNIFTGVKIINLDNESLSSVISSESLNLDADQIFDLNVTYVAEPNTQIAITLKLAKEGSPSLYYQGATNTWINNSQAIINIFADSGGGVSITSLAALPNSGKLTVTINQPFQNDEVTGNTLFNRLNIINKNKSFDVKKGEFHTALRKSRPSSIAKDTVQIFNGDSPSIIFEGAIFKTDNVTPTTTWFRRDVNENFKILQIAVEDVLRASQLPSKVFSGNVYGYIPYLSLIDIDGVDGKFMPIEYSFDTKNNLTILKSLELFGSEIVDDIDYKLTFDFGNTVKPTIL